MNKDDYTKKEIKAIKKDITENGIYNRGFYWSIKDEITFDDIMEVLDALRSDLIYYLDNATIEEIEETIINIRKVLAI